MPAKGLICRYDADHGSFVTPVKLSQHYRTAHADVYVSKPKSMLRYRCRVCPDGKVYVNASSHIYQKHADLASTGAPFVSRYFDVIDLNAPAKNGVDVLDHLHDVEATRQEQQRTPRHVGAWHVDDIVLPVVEQLASPKGLVPVAHLAALFAWRDATSMMLDEVTQRR